MLVMIPDRFIDSCSHTHSEAVKSVYINMDNVVCIDVEKRVQNVWNSKEKEYMEGVETICTVTIQMSNGYYIPLKAMNESLFEEFILWFNKSMGLEKLRGYDNESR